MECVATLIEMFKRSGLGWIMVGGVVDLNPNKIDLLDADLGKLKNLENKLTDMQQDLEAKQREREEIKYCGGGIGTRQKRSAGPGGKSTVCPFKRQSDLMKNLLRPDSITALEEIVNFFKKISKKSTGISGRKVIGAVLDILEGMSNFLGVVGMLFSFLDMLLPTQPSPELLFM